MAEEDRGTSNVKTDRENVADSVKEEACRERPRMRNLEGGLRSWVGLVLQGRSWEEADLGPKGQDQQLRHGRM